MLTGCLSTGTKVVRVVNRRTVDDVLNSSRLCNRLQLRVQLVLAEETAVGIVRAITVIFQFFGMDYLVIKTKPLDDFVNFHTLIGRQTRRLPRDANCAWS